MRIRQIDIFDSDLSQPNNLYPNNEKTNYSVNVNVCDVLECSAGNDQHSGAKNLFAQRQMELHHRSVRNRLLRLPVSASRSEPESHIRIFPRPAPNG